MSTSLTRDQRRSREADIEDAIMAQPEVLGFPMALAIRNFRVADTSGAVDVCLIPQSGPFAWCEEKRRRQVRRTLGLRSSGNCSCIMPGLLRLDHMESTHWGSLPNNSKLKQNALKEHLLKRFFRT